MCLREKESRSVGGEIGEAEDVVAALRAVGVEPCRSAGYSRSAGLAASMVRMRDWKKEMG